MLNYKVIIKIRRITDDIKFKYETLEYNFGKDGLTAYRWAEIAANKVDNPYGHVTTSVEIENVEEDDGKEEA
jgi:hypothetical protein